MNSVSAPSDSPRVKKIWLASYPDIVPAELPPLEHASLAELLEESCARYADRLAFTSMGKSITYRVSTSRRARLPPGFKALASKEAIASPS